MTIKTAFDIMSQSYVQGGSNDIFVLSHCSQLVAELGFFDVVVSFAYHIRIPQDFFH